VTCDSGDVVVVPFPFSEKVGEKRRPAVVLSRRKFNRKGHTAFVMITTKVEPPWPGDWPIADRVAAIDSATRAARSTAGAMPEPASPALMISVTNAGNAP